MPPLLEVVVFSASIFKENAWAGWVSTLIAMIKKWKDDGNTAFHFFRPYTDESESQDKNILLRVHQEQWQKELMCKYGNCISLIDATYKTINIKQSKKQH